MVSAINNAGDISGYFVEGNPTTQQVLHLGFIATPSAAVRASQRHLQFGQIILDLGFPANPFTAK
jgi:hypothetical protein